MFDDQRKITGLCEYIDSVITSDRDIFAERMIQLKGDIASSLARNFKGSKNELDFLLARL